MVNSKRKEVIMLNQVILVGRLAHNPELQFTETGKKRSKIGRAHV